MVGICSWDIFRPQPPSRSTYTYPKFFTLGFFLQNSLQEEGDSPAYMPRTIQGARISISTADLKEADHLEEWQQHFDHTSSPFDRVSQGLAEIGGLSIEQFLSKSNGLDDLDVAFHLQVPVEKAMSPPRVVPQQIMKRSSGQSPSVVKDPNGLTPSKTPTTQPISAPADHVAPRRDYSPITVMHQTCQRAFGSSVNVLNFEFLEDDPRRKQCILTITRPNGASRAYQTEPVFKKRADAKSEVCGIAIDMGALDFILTGESEVLKAKKGDLLAPPSVGDRDKMDADENGVVTLRGPPQPQEGEAVRMIEECCVEWRAGKVKPHWVSLGDKKVGHGMGNRYGAALRISLTPHAFRAYSTNTLYASRQEAKAACARAAVDEGVLEYIKHGNGQMERLKVEDESDSGKEEDVAPEPETAPLSLQEFYESLPQPFHEPVGDKSASEINGPAWINTNLQTARGAQLLSNFTWITNNTHGVHGCLLRVDRPGESKTYLVDPRFVKRADAKAAVCLLAMSQGLGDFIRTAKEEAEQRLSPERRKLAHDKIIPALTAECNKVRAGNRIIFDFVQERDAFGCTVKIDISSFEDKPDVREYSVNTEYRNKVDSKLAAVCVAAEQGAFELLKFRGGALPPAGYQPFWELITGNAGKRKGPDQDADLEGRERKKQRKTKEGSIEQGEVVDSEVEVAMEVPKPEPPVKTPTTNSNSIKLEGNVTKGSWKVPHGSATTGLAPDGDSARAGPSTAQGRPGNRNVGGTSGRPDGRAPYPRPTRGHHNQQHHNQQRLPPRPNVPYDGANAGYRGVPAQPLPPPPFHPPPPSYGVQHHPMPPAAPYAPGPHYGGHQVPYSGPPAMHNRPYLPHTPPHPYYAAPPPPAPYGHPPYGYHYPQPLGAPPGSYPMHPPPQTGYASGYAPSVGPMSSPPGAAGFADPYSLNPHPQAYSAYSSPQGHPPMHLDPMHNHSDGRGYGQQQQATPFFGAKRGRHVGHRS